ncbi:MAG: hypothetical protein H6612_03525 [Ignavibacteriales bacterium]|nr:hypothetical protein [Ignavibacteriales bacterium]MCB9258400.1 hypothetical protein [Ignavibacteriales bacterium]
MKMFLIFLITLSFINNCNDESKKMIIYYYNTGGQSIIEVDNKTEELIIEHITELFFNTSDRLRVHLNDNRITHLKENEEIIEIKFKSLQKFNSQLYGENSVNMVLFPLSGDLIGNAENPIITILVGEGNYNTGPYRNKAGLNKLNELKEIIKENLENNFF